MHPVSCTNSHHGVTYLVNHGMVKNTKTRMSRERNITFPRNKKIINLCPRRCILRSYRFVAKVTFNLLIIYGSYSHRRLSVVIPNCLTRPSTSYKICFQYTSVPLTELKNENALSPATNLEIVPLTVPAFSVPGLILCIAKFDNELSGAAHTQI